LSFCPSENSPALQQPDDQNDCGDDQKNVDQTAGVEREKSQGPQNEQDDQDCSKHTDLLFFFRLSPSSALPLSDVVMGWGEAPSLSAVFMPGSFRSLKMLENGFLL
jgi:hypothetical protein